MTEFERYFAEVVRKRRRDAIKLIVVSSLFVVAGVVIVVGPGHPIGLLCLLFFGGCLLVGIAQLIGEERLPGRVLLVVAAGATAVGCAFCALLESLGVPVIGGWRYAPGFTIPVFAIGALFYGAAAVIGVIQLVRFVRGDWARPPARSRRRRR